MVNSRINRCRWMVVLLAMLLGGASAEVKQDPPTSGYEKRQIEGWIVYVNRELLDRQDLSDRVLKLLGAKLYEVTRVVPASPLARLREVPIWVEYKNKVPGAQYHPSRQWLQGHGYNPDKAGGVEISNAENFLSWSLVQPALVLHELAHSYHHRVLGYDHPGIKAAFKNAVDKHLYDSVQYFDASKKRAYALTSDQEYFAECSEAYFGTNDFFPFVKAELKTHDPAMFEVLEQAWHPKR